MLGTLGMFSSVVGPTIEKKVLKLVAISLSSSIIFPSCVIEMFSERPLNSQFF